MKLGTTERSALAYIRSALILFTLWPLFPLSSFAKEKADQESAQDRLFAAIREGDTNALKKAVIGVDLNQPNRSAIDLVPPRTQTNVTHLFVGPPVFETEGELIARRAHHHFVEHTRLPLHAAIWRAKSTGETDIVEMLLDAGADIDGKLPSNHKTALHMAIEHRHPSLIELFLDRGADVNAADKDGMTALHRASATGIDIEIFKRLIRLGADVNARDAKGRSALRLIVDQIHGEPRFDHLLRRGADVDSSDAQGVSLLQAAIKRKQKRLAQKLIAAGAMIDTADESGNTPLLQALFSEQYDLAYAITDRGGLKRIKQIPLVLIRHQKVGAIRFLLERGVDPNQPDPDGNTSLHLAAANTHGLIGFSIGSKAQAMLVTLLKHGADPMKKNKVGKRPYDIAVERKFYEIAKILSFYMRPVPPVDPLQLYSGRIREDYAALRMQLSGAKTLQGKMDKYDRPLILSAARKLDSASVEFLLQTKAERDGVAERAALNEAVAQGSWLMTKLFFDAGVTFTAEGARKAFHAGLKKGGFELTELLFEQGLRINADGASPLFAAIKKGDPSLVELLLECGSNVNQRGRFGKTPLIEAFEQDRRGIAGILLARKDLRAGAATDSGLTALHIASGQGHLKWMDRLIDLGADIEALERGGYTPLHWACRHNQLETARILVAQGADVNFQARYKKSGKVTNVTYESPLHAAAGGYRATELLEFLLKIGAKVDTRDRQGKTPLHVAANGYRQVELVKRLLDSGADVNAIDGRKGYAQMSALQYAAAGGNKDVVRLLLDHGATVDQADYTGYTALFLASTKYTAIVSMLLEKGANPNLASVTYRRTPLHQAVLSQDQALIKLLLQYGARIDAKNSDGESPLDLARKLKNARIVELLEAP